MFTRFIAKIPDVVGSPSSRYACADKIPLISPISASESARFKSAETERKLKTETSLPFQVFLPAASDLSDFEGLVQDSPSP